MPPTAVKPAVPPLARLLAACCVIVPIALHASAPSKTAAHAAPATAPATAPASVAPRQTAETEPPAPREQPAVPHKIVVPAPARLLYDVTAQLHGARLNGEAQLRWQHDGEKYEARLEIRALSVLLRSQISTGSIGPAGLVPERFVDRTRSERVVAFDHEHRRIVFDDGALEAPLEPRAQDRLSVTLQLSSMLAGDPAAFARGATIALQTAGASDAEIWHFTVKREETLPFSSAELRSLKLERDPRREGDQRIEIWFAPLLGYLPVRLKLTQPDGDFVEQRLRVIEKP